VDDELSREQCLTWLAEQDLRQLSLPVLVVLPTEVVNAADGWPVADP
jgi:hypothetical protein